MNLWTDRGWAAAAGGIALCLCASCGRGPSDASKTGGAAPAGAPPSGAGAAAASAALGQAQSNAPIADLRIPLDHWPDGKVKTQVFAASARMAEEGGRVDASRIRIETYRPDGTVENRVLARDCSFDREKGSAASDGDVHFEREGMLITGRGFVWNEAEERINILRDVRVVLQRNLRWDRVLPAGRPQEGGKTE